LHAPEIPPPAYGYTKEMSRGIAIDSSTTATKAVVCDRDRHAALRR
jgi:hypothetical protein